MEKIKILYEKMSSALEKALEALAVFILGAGAIAIFANVIARYFGTTFGFLEEGPRLFLCFAVLPIFGVLYKRGRHIYVEILPNRLKGWPKSFLMVIIDMAMIAGSSMLLSAGISGTKAVYDSGIRVVGVLDIPEYILMVSIPIGAGILLLYSIEAMVKNIVSLFSNHEPIKKIGPDPIQSEPL